jgi:hypothetical protein
LVNRPRTRALGVGLAIVGLYAALAVVSGTWSPTARGPLLDGLGPVNYRWVSPPPELASTNQQPTSGEFSLKLGDDGVKSGVFFTSDNQVTVIVAPGSIAAAPGQETVDLSVVPLDPATMPAPGDDLTVFGNAYAITATYQPSGKQVTKLSDPLDVIVVYPATATLHANSHEMLFAANGQGWEALDSHDSPSQQQAEANVPGFGTVAAAGVVSAQPTPGGTGSGGRTTLAIVLLVLAGCALLLGIGLLLRSRRA